MVSMYHCNGQYGLKCRWLHWQNYCSPDDHSFNGCSTITQFDLLCMGTSRSWGLNFHSKDITFLGVYPDHCWFFVICSCNTLCLALEDNCEQYFILTHLLRLSGICQPMYTCRICHDMTCETRE